MRGLIMNILLYFFYFIHHCRLEEEIYMQLDLFATGTVTSIKIIGKAALADLPNTQNALIHKKFSGKPNSKLEIKINYDKMISLAAVLHVGTTKFSTNDLTYWKDSNNQNFAVILVNTVETQYELNGTKYNIIGNSTISAKDLTFIFEIPERSFCANATSKGIVPVNYVVLSQIISPSLSNYIYSSSSPIRLLLTKNTDYGNLRDKIDQTILANIPFDLKDNKYDGTKYGKEIIEYKIESYPEICKFEIRVCHVSCDECMGNTEVNMKNEYCTKCSSYYTKVPYTTIGNEFICFVRENKYPNYYLDPKYDVFYPCEKKCIYCSLKPGQTVASCDECNYPYYIELKDTKECYTKDEYKASFPNYYLDSVAEKYLECNITCSECIEPDDGVSTKCKKCSSGYAFYEGIGDDENCILIKDDNSGFILVGDTYKKCDIACKKCYKPAENNCKVCNSTTSFIDGTTYCTDNSKNQIVIDGKPYYKDSGNQNYYPCHTLCSSCLIGEAPLNHNCENCKEDYVFKEDEKFNCFPTITEEDKATFIGYYYNEENNIYMKCFPICSECTKSGDEKSNNCDKCVDGYSVVSDQAGRCIMKTGVLDGYYYNADRDVFIKCYSQCSGCTDEGSLKDQKCLSCKTGLFLMTINSNCINPEPISLGKFLDDITLLFPKTDPIKPLEISSGGYKYILYPYSMQTSIDNYVPYLSFNDCIDIIKDYCSIHDLNDLLIAQIAHNSTKIASTQTYFKFYLKNGNELDLSKLIEEKITFNASFRLVANETSLNFDYAKELEKLKIDYYNPEDAFYNTLCLPFTKGSKDLGLVDRRNIIFPKVKLCQQGCIYQEILFSNYSVKCNCSFDKTVNDTRSFITDDESSNNFILFKCFSLLAEIKFDSPIIIVAFCLLGLKVICIVWMIITYSTPINAKLNSIVSNPPKKKDPKQLEEEEVSPSSRTDINHSITQMKVNSTIKSTNKSKISIRSQNSFAEPIINENEEEEEKEKEDEIKIDSLNSKDGFNTEVREDVLQLRTNKMKSSTKEQDDLFEKKIEEKAKEKEMKENAKLVQNNSDNKTDKEVDSKLPSKENKIKKQEINLNEKESNEFNKEEVKIKKEVKENKRSSLKKKSANNYLEEKKEQNEINDKPKRKRISRGINENNRESVLSSSIDLGFESSGTKLSSDEANIASFSEIEYDCDSRRFWRHFFDIYLEKQMIFTLFKTDNIFYPLSFRLLMFFFNISSLFFFNSLLYSPYYLTKRLETKENIDFVYLIVEEYDKALYSALFAFLVGKVYYLIYYSNSSFLRLLKDARKNSALILRLKKINQLKLFGLVIFLSAFMAVYYSFVFIFCILYPNNISGLIYSFLMSLVFNFVINAVTCTLISFSRYIGIDNHLK